VLCASARLYFLSLAEAQRPQRTSMFILFLPQHLCVLCALARVNCFFLSQRRGERRGMMCFLQRKYLLFNFLCALCAFARVCSTAFSIWPNPAVLINNRGRCLI
jgi:hypothetical protein